MTDWYSPTSNVYPFVYKFEDEDLILTKVIYTSETHLFLNFLKFPYYTVKEIKYTDCFCFQNNFCTEEYHGENMRSTHGYSYYHCTQFVLYNCKFFDRLYDKIYICSECSLLKVQNRIYSLYIDSNQQDIQLPPKYKSKTLYQHVFDGEEPGYYSGGGGTCYELENIGYKMGVKIMCDLPPHYKKGEQIFDYLFDYKTSIATLKKMELKLYLHLGNLEKDDGEVQKLPVKVEGKEVTLPPIFTTDDKLKNIEERLERMEKRLQTFGTLESQRYDSYAFKLINDYVSDSDDEQTS